MNFYESIKKHLNETSSKNRRMNLIKYSSDGYTDVSKTDGEYKGEPLVNYNEKDFKKGTSVLTPFICYDCDAGFYVKSSVHDFFQQGDFDDPYEIPKGEFLYCPKCKSNNIDCNGYPLIKEPGVKETITEADDLSAFKKSRNIKYTKMKTNGVKDAKSTLYDVILRDANKKYSVKSITREERNKIIDDAHDKLIKGKSNNILDTISDELIEKARKDFIKDYPRKRDAQKVTTEIYKKLINEADDSYMEEWRSICEAFCNKIGAELLFVNTDNFGYTDKDGNNVHMYADELEQFIKNGGLKESDESDLTCFACGRPTTERDDNNKPVCSECYSYISDLVGHGEWIEEEYHEKATYDDFKDFSPYWGKYFKTLDFEDIPWDALTDEAYEIYMRMPHSF